MAGARLKFTAVDWRGDDSQIPVPTQGDISPNYYVNVKNAFMTAPALVWLCGQLSWRGRFAGIQNAVNCYSPTEDVLTNPTTNKIFGVESSNFGGAWSKQELFKGCALWYGVNAVTFSGTEIEGGWGINSAYMANPLAYVPFVGLRPSYFEDWTHEDMITNPLFTSFDDERMASTNVLAIVDDELRAKILGDAIPAESFAAGANWTKGLSENYNLQNGTMEKWPVGCCKKVEGISIPQWLHSDIKDVSFFYVSELFKKITKESGP